MERWRDLTHIRSYTRREWLGFFADAGLTVEETAVHRKTHEMADWLARSRTAPGSQARVFDALRSATPDARARLGIAYDDRGEPISFADEKLLARGRKR